jgi:hypothetical protein
LSEPIKGLPDISFQANTKSHGILIATNSNLKADTADFQKCLKGLKLNFGLKSEVKIIDEFYFHETPDKAILSEIKTEYNAGGLLLLTKLNVQRKSYEVPSKKLFLIHRIRDKVDYPPYYGPIPWTNLYVKITSRWEYHDFLSGNSYVFSVKTDEVLECEQYVADIDSFIGLNFKLLDRLIYINGSNTAYSLLGLNPE